MSVRVEAMCKRFGLRKEVVGVDQVSFTAPEHRITSLLGPSGSGKSTLLRLVAGLEVPDSGKVEIHGEDVTRTPVRERRVGFVFQNYALFRHMTVFDNVAFGLSVRRAPKSEIQGRVERLLSLVQLGGYERRFPDQLSGGQRQRIALARALATEPRVLLLDEPFGALDARVRVELREWLRSMHEQTHVTTLLVTHDQEEALELSEHVVLLADGQIQQAGSPSELYENPRSGFVASFLGGAKVLTGSVAQGKASFGPIGLSTAVDLADGARVEAFVRPHDVRLEKVSVAQLGTELDGSPGASGADSAPRSTEPGAREALVERLVKVGSYVKLSVLLPGGDRLNVQMPRHEVEERGIAQGDRVLLEVRNVKVSPAIDYVI
ncbi:MAG TPA: sulfate ABC transporter ATP-binding protein [Polyangiaceae bacterium]|nr:sulfate ABC transporter ATP-binding protein [Polyangiaceae bacterium]